MDVQAWTFLIVGLSFALYLGIAWYSRAGSSSEFYVAGGGVPPLANGMATGADWMSAASFISMAGIISFAGYDGSTYLMGWTGGYVLLALLLAPYLRKFGKFTVPDFVGDRCYSQFARVVAVICAIFVSFTYVSGQMRGVGVVFSQFLGVDINLGIIIGMAIVFVYAVLGGMKGITYTQVAQYCVLIFAYMVPAIFMAMLLTGNFIPQLGFIGNLGGDVGSQIAGGQTIGMLDKLDAINTELGFNAFTDGSKSRLDVFMITLALMVGTAGLPHVIIRFYTVPKVRDARMSAFWALFFIAILYTTAPAVGAFGRTNLIATVEQAYYNAEAAPDTPDAKTIPDWFKEWEDTGLLAWVDKDNDGRVDYRSGAPFAGKPKFSAPADDPAGRGTHGQRLVTNTPSANANELYVDRDIMVLANPQIARLPNWVVGLVAAGGLAAALSTAAGLLLVISTAVSHDLLKRVAMPSISEKQELWVARAAAGIGVILAGLVGIFPPGFVAEVVALAFGLAASSFFPCIMLGIFSKRASREGIVAGMISGISFTAIYIVLFKFNWANGLLAAVSGWEAGKNKADYWLWGISPEGIGSIGMLINFAVAIVVSRFTPPPPKEIQDLIENIRVPKGAGEAHEMQIPPPQQGD
ncbi:MAG: cation acetate symporter [Planctomycetota bacterium]|nr:MAG: cation acetate symporter [Planctomycetota bacterium]